MDVECKLCQFFRKAASQVNNEERVKFRRAGSRILIERDNALLASVSLARSIGPGESPLSELPLPTTAAPGSLKDTKFLRANIQISSPHLYGTNRMARSKLIRLWLLDCDEGHENCRRGTSVPTISFELLPKRLLHIGTEHDPMIRLIGTASINDHDQEELRYAALSYQWGHKDLHQHYQTTTANVEKLKTGVLICDLPKLYQDAINVTRGIDLKYLWIDSLCIVQGRYGDAEFEIQRMETVFSSAYCVIAASRANGTSEGFLQERTSTSFVKIPGSSLFVKDDIDNFRRDVIDGELNQRGWVLQERALARRTIYFTATQIYWECGEGIRCETMTRMTK